jgi:MFS family permease
MVRTPVLNKPLALAGIGRPVDAALTPEQMQANARRLILEVTWYGILIGTTINLMQVYVVRLGAPAVLVGAVTFGPALVSIFWQIPANQWLRRSGHRMQWVLATGLLHRLAYLAVALLPFFVSTNLAALTVMILVIQAFATTLSGTSFLSMMADAIPSDQVSQVVSGRLAGFGFTSTVSTLVASLILTRLVFPLNYQVLFLIGFTASMASQWHVMRIRVPDRQPAPAVKGHLRQEFGGMWQLKRYMQYVGIVGVIQMALGMVGPLMPLFAVRRLGATDGQISLVVTAFSAASVLGSIMMRRLVKHAGRERVLAVGALGYALYPLLISLSPTVGWLIPWAALGGIFYAAISVTLFDNLLAVTPGGDRTTFVSIYNLFVNIALFIGPLLAAILARGTMDPAPALQVAAGISLAAGALGLLWRRGRLKEVVSNQG